MQARAESNVAKKRNRLRSVIIATIIILAGLLFIAIGSPFADAFRQSSSGRILANVTQWLFALNHVQLWWYVTRSAGLVAYLLLWLSTAWGLAVSSKITDTLLHRAYTYDFHQFISLLAIGFMILHFSVLYLDRYLPFSIVQVLVPFTSNYRPVWVGIGIISFYIMLLVTVTFYMRRRIGVKAFRSIHVLSLVGYLGATLHGLFAGTDSPLVSMQLIYKGSFLVIIFLTAYWLMMLAQKRFRSPQNTFRADQV